MELKDFIKETISQIAESVNELNELMPEKLMVNPETTMGIGKIPNVETHDGYYRNVINVDFDLVLTEENEAGTHGKIGVFASVLSVGGATDEGTKNKAENRIRFSLPVVMPSRKTK